MRRGRPTRRHGRVDLGRGRGGGGTRAGGACARGERCVGGTSGRGRRRRWCRRGGGARARAARRGARRRWRRSSRGWRSRVGVSERRGRRAPRPPRRAWRSSRGGVPRACRRRREGNEGGEERSGAARVEDARRREPRRWRTRDATLGRAEKATLGPFFCLARITAGYAASSRGAPSAKVRPRRRDEGEQTKRRAERGCVARVRGVSRCGGPFRNLLRVKQKARHPSQTHGSTLLTRKKC